MRHNLEIEPFVFTSTQNGFKKLLMQLQSLSCDCNDIIVGMEATGLLFENLYHYFKEFSYRVVLLNPYQSAKFREMDTMKRVKNDNIDSVMIAALIKSGRLAHCLQWFFLSLKRLSVILPASPLLLYLRSILP